MFQTQDRSCKKTVCRENVEIETNGRATPFDPEKDDSRAIEARVNDIGFKLSNRREGQP